MKPARNLERVAIAVAVFALVLYFVPLIACRLQQVIRPRNKALVWLFEHLAPFNCATPDAAPPASGGSLPPVVFPPTQTGICDGHGGIGWAYYDAAGRVVGGICADRYDTQLGRKLSPDEAHDRQLHTGPCNGHAGIYSYDGSQVVCGDGTRRRWYFTMEAGLPWESGVYV